MCSQKDAKADSGLAGRNYSGTIGVFTPMVARPWKTSSRDLDVFGHLVAGPVKTSPGLLGSLVALCLGLGHPPLGRPLLGSLVSLGSWEPGLGRPAQSYLVPLGTWRLGLARFALGPLISFNP